MGLLSSLSAMALFTAALGAAQSRDARLAEAMAHVSAGRFETAGKILGSLAAEAPDDIEVRYRLGLVLLRLNKVVPAAGQLEHVAAVRGDFAGAWLAVAEARMRLGKEAQALEAAGRAQALGRNDPSVARAVAMFYVAALESAVAAGNAEMVSTLSGKLPELRDERSTAAFRHLLGKWSRIRGDPASAAQHFQEAIRLQPSVAAYYLDLARMFLDHRTPEPAQVVLQAGLRVLPDDVELWRAFGLAHLGKANTSAAADAFLRAIDLAPDREDLYASLETLIVPGEPRLGEIAAKVRAFSERRPSSPLGYYLRALIVKIEPSEAATPAALLGKAAAVAPDFWPALYELHEYRKDDNPSEAATLLERVVALNPEFAPARYALARTYAVMGDRERARKEREAHHRLVSRQRAETEKLRKSMPRLSYDYFRAAEPAAPGRRAPAKVR